MSDPQPDASRGGDAGSAAEPESAAAQPESVRPPPPEEGLKREVVSQEARKIAARRQADRSVWFGLGMFGLVGWSIAIPALVGIAIGAWIDAHWPSPVSWTLMLLFVGVVVGCVTAWRWISQEQAAAEDEEP